MSNNFTVPVCHVRKDDWIWVEHANRYAKVVESRQYLGNPNDENHPDWVVDVMKFDDEWDWQSYPTYGYQESDDYESPEPHVPFDCRTQLAFSSWDDEVEIQSDKIETLDAQLKPIRWWVAVYEVGQGFGGHEEGGWWFSTGEVKQVAAASSYDEAQEIASKLRDEWQDESNVPTHSVIYNGGNYEVRVKGSYPQDYPQRVPHYS